MMGQQPGPGQRHGDKNGEISPDEGAASGAPGRQESPEERHARIAEIAYRNAGERGFAPGGELEDWLAAEREVTADPPTRSLG